MCEIFNVTMSKPSLTRITSYLYFLLTCQVSVRGNNATQPVDLPTCIFPSNNTTPSASLKSSISKTTSLSPTFDSEISGLLDENFHNGSLSLDFSMRDDDGDSSSAVELLRYFLSSDGKETRATVREIIIPWLPANRVDHIEDLGPERWYNYSQLLDFVAKVENLENFRWQNGRIPGSLFAAIEHNHPDSCLHLDHGYIDTALAHSHLICSIKAHALDRCTAPSVWPWISKILAESSSIRSLTVESGTCGCVSSWTRQALDFYENTRFPALEEIRLIGYNAYAFEGPAYEFPKRHKLNFVWDQIILELEGFFWKLQRRITGMSEKTNLEAWHEAMDWTKLRVLELNRLSVDTLKSINWSMPSLESFRSDLPEVWMIERSHDRATYNEALSAFVSRLSRLQSMGLRNVYRPFSFGRIADIHGQSLKSLELRGHYVGCGPYLDDTIIEQIRDQFPALEDLEIDLYRNGTWPNSTLEVLSSFPCLTNLTLWLELGGNGYTLPLLTNSSATSLFHDLRAQKNGTDLIYTTFYLGGYDANPSRGLNRPNRPSGRSAKVECIAEQGAAPDDGACHFHGYDPSRPESANWHIGYWDEYRALSLFPDELEG